MDDTVADQELCMIILRGWPLWFEHLIVAIDTIAEGDKLTVMFEERWLLQEEQHLNSSSADST